MRDSWELEKVGQVGKHDEATVDAALLALALNGSEYSRTAKDLAAGGIKLDERTLREWRDRYPNRYRFHLQENVGRVEGQAVAGYLQVIRRAQEAMMDAIELEHQRIKRGDVRDASSSARNLATSAGIATQHNLNLQGRPTIIQEVRKPEDIARRLRELGLTFDAEGSASWDHPPSEIERSSAGSVPPSTERSADAQPSE